MEPLIIDSIIEKIDASVHRFDEQEKVISEISQKVLFITDQSAVTQLRIPENKGTSEKPFNIITAGRLRFEKDFSTLIKAFSLLPDKENVRLTIYGEGPEREKLNRLIKDLSLEEHVSMPGFSNTVPLDTIGSSES